MRSPSNYVINWKKKSILDNHFKLVSHNEKNQQAHGEKAKKQTSIITCMGEAEKVKVMKDDLNRSLINACLKANIPLHQLSNPAFQQWLVENVKGECSTRLIFLFPSILISFY